MKLSLRVALFTLLAVYALGAAAQHSPPRRGKGEFTLQPQYTDSLNVSNGNGSQAHLDGALGFGFGLAFNLNNNLSLGGDFFWNRADYQATVAPAEGNLGNTYTVKGELETSTIRFNATWHFSASDFTPFVTGGIGSTYVNTNVPNGPPQNVCWWDPWWGYYCGSYVPTRTATDLSYTGAFGLRWDVDRNMFLRGVFSRMWIDVGGELGTPFVDQYRVDVGFKF
jgi:opacity protein-like surface antigen